MPNYQFVSTNLAHRFPRHLASRIVLSYESVYPRTITAQRWPSSATAAQLLCGGQQWSSGLGFESIGYVLFSSGVMWIGVLLPRWFQQVLLAGLLCLTIWLLLLLVHFTQEDHFVAGLCVAGAVVAAILLVAVSYYFSWDNDSEHSQAAADAISKEESKVKEDAGGDALSSEPSPAVLSDKSKQQQSRKASPTKAAAASSAPSSPSPFLRFKSLNLNLTPNKANKVAPAPLPNQQPARSVKDAKEAKEVRVRPSALPSRSPAIDVESKHDDDIESNSSVGMPIGMVSPFVREEYYLSSSSSDSSI
jgi:hypothetical protein